MSTGQMNFNIRRFIRKCSKPYFNVNIHCFKDRVLLLWNFLQQRQNAICSTKDTLSPSPCTSADFVQVTFKYSRCISTALDLKVETRHSQLQIDIYHVISILLRVEMKANEFLSLEETRWEQYSSSVYVFVTVQPPEGIDQWLCCQAHNLFLTVVIQHPHTSVSKLLLSTLRQVAMQVHSLYSLILLSIQAQPYYRPHQAEEVFLQQQPWLQLA